MFFIYSSLPIGGIETFIVRMAKERFKKNLNTSILLLSSREDNNETLLNEMKKYSKVYFTDDFFYKVPFLTKYFPLLAPIIKKNVEDAFYNIEQIHAPSGLYGLLGNRLLQLVNRRVPITVGSYHYITYVWGGSQIAHYEKINRRFVFDYLPRECILFFSQGNLDFHTRHLNKDFNKSQTFRLGVVDKKNINIRNDILKPLRIIAIGRLVDFKTYNLFMLDVVKGLKNHGYDIQFDIYGDGPLYEDIKSRIELLSLASNVSLKGTLDYHQFDEVVSGYDLFIGSGTAIIQAASLGVPSIVGIENIIEPKTYGYFCDVCQYEYNIKGLELPLFDINEIIENFINLDFHQRLTLKKAHVESIDKFTNESCQDSMNALSNIQMPNSHFKTNLYLYELSRAIDQLNYKLNKKHPRRVRFEFLRK